MYLVIDDEGNLKGYDADTGEAQTIKHSTIPIRSYLKMIRGRE